MRNQGRDFQQLQKTQRQMKLARHKASEEDADPSIEEMLAGQVRRHILSGRLPPGTKLGEEMLTEVFAVNRSRIRRVLQILAFDRLVELKANRGAFIASPSIKEARDVFEARRVIERVTTEIVARTILTPQLIELGRIVEKQRDASVQGESREVIGLAGDFHRYLCGLAHNTALAQVLEPLILRTALIIALYGTSQAAVTMYEHHARLLQLIESGKSLEAARAMEQCLYVLESTLDLRERHRREPDLKSLLTMIS
ncbi:GntR family transcriptional regulator [Mesorhizobium sp. CGMCC 1.15528]|uniref:GntR family transcriptional regulator n=1 Tax=Mesorhizobium zhangyense TaxID=1776730 RepID=A0A7C9RBI6_9HYPH|nr:GntR family transcriptional regulator [Mesorhizobium zhangyense]NGN44537.1 GntR family transcriptional regulator [Mesorhizobium zhangyense]